MEVNAEIDYMDGMDFNLYQELVVDLAVYPDRDNNLIYVVLGGLGEFGEIANQVKKILRDDDGVLTTERRDKIIDELGDAQWYIAATAHVLGISLEELAQRNIAKLHYRRGRDELHGDQREE